MITGTRYFFDSNRDRMTSLSATADRLQTQVATGKKLTAASQDAAGWQRLQGLVQAKSDAGAYAANVTLAKAIMAQTDSALGAVQTGLQRANELAIKANSGTLDATARAAIAEELDTIVADLDAQADAKDARGQPLFDAEAGSIPIGDGIAVIANSGRDAVFGSIATAIATFAGQLRNGTTTDLSANAATAIAAIGDAVGTVAAQQGSLGARAARVELFAQTAQDAAVMVETQRASVEDADLTTTIADLQKTMTILQATQASFSKLSQLSLFDYLR